MLCTCIVISYFRRVLRATHLAGVRLHALLFPLTFPCFDKPNLAMPASLPPDESVAWKVWLGTVVSVVLATVAVALRLLARRLSAAPFWWDDWTILASLVRTGSILTAPRCANESDFSLRQCNGAWAFLDSLSSPTTITAIMLFMSGNTDSPYLKRLRPCSLPLYIGRGADAFPF